MFNTGTSIATFGYGYILYYFIDVLIFGILMLVFGIVLLVKLKNDSERQAVYASKVDLVYLLFT